MPKNAYYIIADGVLSGVAKIYGMSMGVLTDVLTEQGDKIESETIEGAVSLWIDSHKKNPKYPDDTKIEVWDERFNRVGQGIPIEAPKSTITDKIRNQMRELKAVKQAKPDLLKRWAKDQSNDEISLNLDMTWEHLGYLLRQELTEEKYRRKIDGTWSE